MQMRLQPAAVFVVAIGCLVLAEGIAVAQQDRTPRRLRSPATVRSFIGGESADYYVIRARKGQTLIVRVSWRREGDNIVSFRVDDVSTGEEAPGKESQNGRRWVGRIRRTGDYEISVGAHPTAQYTLRVTLK